MPTDPPSGTDDFRTRVSLLNRLKNLEDAASWEEFFKRYESMVRGVARQRGLQESEAEEVVMDVFRRVARSIQEFQARERPGSFRSWLFRLTRWRAQDKLRERQRGWRTTPMADVAAVADRLGGEVAARDEELEQESRRHILDALFRRMEQSVPQKQIQIFRLMMIDDVPVARVCELFGITRSFAYVIKHRLLARLREEARRLPLPRD